jgi:hypothetical protein
MDNDISSDFFAITLTMAGQRPTHFPGMLPPFELSDDPAIQTTVTPPAGPITQTQEMFYRTLRCRQSSIPIPSCRGLIKHKYGDVTRVQQ